MHLFSEIFFFSLIEVDFALSGNLLLIYSWFLSICAF